MIAALRIAALGCLLASPEAMASGNNLTMVGATYDTTGMKYGTGALSGGYGVTAPGACYVTTQAQSPPQVPAEVTGGFDVWVKAPSALPSNAQLIIGAPASYIAETTSGFPAFGIGSSFVSGVNYSIGTPPDIITINESIADGKWHRLTLLTWGTPGGMVTGSGSIDGNPAGGPGATFVADQTDPALVARNQQKVFIGGGGLGQQFAGEIDEASCWTYGVAFALGQAQLSAIGPTPLRWSGTEPGLLGLWQLDANGTDSSTWTVPFVNAPPASTNARTANPAAGLPLAQ